MPGENFFGEPCPDIVRRSLCFAHKCLDSHIMHNVCCCMRTAYMKRDGVVKLLRANVRQARLRWRPFLNATALQTLRSYTEEFHFSVPAGDLVLLDRGWYVTHSGLLRLARRTRCLGIQAEPV